MNDITISVVENQNSTYLVQVLGTEAKGEFRLHFDLAERQELRSVLAGISRGDADGEFVNQLKTYGSKLYNLLFNGAVGEEFRRLCTTGFCLRLLLPPSLEALPWEYLVDGGDFLFRGREDVLIRRPSLEEKEISLPTISLPVRLLVIISNPPDLPENKKLDIVTEKRLIKEALKPLIDEGRLVVKWEDEASLERIHDALLAFKPQIIHYTGHGGFDEAKGGVLLLEDGRDKSLNVGGVDLAERLAGRDVRLVVLSGCQTATAKTTDSFSSVAGALVKKGIPAVIAMQQSIRDDSATMFASRFYKAIASGQPVDLALGEARLSMQSPRPVRGRNVSRFVDWGIPVLITSVQDLNLFHLDETAPQPALPAPKGFSKINLPNPGDIFVGRQIEQRRIARALRGGDARCIMILGPGGIGKSSLAARAVEQSEEDFHAVLTMGCKAVPTAEQILLELNAFLMLNGNTQFAQVMQAPLEIAQKIEYLPQALNAARYLIIFDNFEDMLDATREPHVIQDELVRHLLEVLTMNLKESRVLITSRLGFSFTRDRRYQGNVLTVTLRDLTRMEAFRLMEHTPALSETATADEKLRIYEKAGGSPYIIDLVASAAQDVPIGNVLADIEQIQKEFVETMLLTTLYEWLPDDATRTFFRRASVYRKPVNQDFLVAVGGNDERIGYLLHKSLLNRIAGNVYEMHTNTRTFASDLHEELDGVSGVKETQLTAAEMYYLNAGKGKGDVGDLLESRWFFFAAGEYDTAGELVKSLTEPLSLWGFKDIVRDLNEETAETAAGEIKAAALHHLGMVHQDQGRYEEAVKKYEESLELKKELGDKSGIALSEMGIGMIYADKGEYDKAIEKYEKCLKISDNLGDKRNIARTLHLLGMIHEDQGRYEEAVKKYEESLELKKKLEDKRGIVITLYQLGNVHYLQDRYEEAVNLYEETLKVMNELGDKKGIAASLHQLGMIHQDQGRYEEAVKKYEESLELEKELGDKSGIAASLHQLGMIHQSQGRYEEAVNLCVETLKLTNELGDKKGIATSRGQLGRIFQAQGNYKEALHNYLIAFAIFLELDSPNKEVVGQLVRELKEELGDELFKRYTEELAQHEQ